MICLIKYTNTSNKAWIHRLIVRLLVQRLGWLRLVAPRFARPPVLLAHLSIPWPLPCVYWYSCSAQVFSGVFLWRMFGLCLPDRFGYQALGHSRTSKACPYCVSLPRARIALVYQMFRSVVHCCLKPEHSFVKVTDGMSSQNLYFALSREAKALTIASDANVVSITRSEN